MSSKSIEISDEVMCKAHEEHLLFLLASALGQAVRVEVGTYYPNGSILAMLPSNVDLEKARASVINQARKTNYANLVPYGCGLRPLFEKKDAHHRAFLKEMVANIGAHAQEIGRHLLNGIAPTRIFALNADGGDPHNESRHTIVVETDAGAFLYKPHSMKPDKVIKRLCDELFPSMFYVPRAIDCTTFGFSEFVDNVDPAGTDELDNYFKALGTFCALAYCLSLSDLHAENFLARGSQLVPIDLETVFESAFKLVGNRSESSSMAVNRSGANGSDRFSHDIGRSIVSTGMFSCIRGNIVGAILSGTSHRIAPVNTRHESIDHKAQVVSGFEYGYMTCLKNKARIRAAMTELQGTRMRVLLEATTFYHIILQRLFNTSTWNSTGGIEAVEHSLHLPEHEPLGEAVLNAEAASILKGDFPAFYFMPECRGLFDGNGVVDPKYLDTTPLCIALEQLDNLDEKDLRFQSCILSKAIDNMPLMTDAKPAPIETTGEPLACNAALAEVARILALTYEEIIPGLNSRGGLWATHYGEMHKSTMDCSLGTGYAGVGVFAAACLATHVGDENHAKTLLDICLHELDCQVNTMHKLHLSVGNDAGLVDGIGGVARALQLIWTYTVDGRVLGIYAGLLHAVEDAELATIGGNNVYNGLAGLLLPLASKIPGLPECSSVEKIGDMLLGRASIDTGGHHVWMERDGVCGEVGYGKGTGGIGLTLLGAWQATGEKRFWDACCDAIAYEDSRYSAELGFWPLNAQTRKKKISPPGICRGVAGQAVVFTQAAQAGVPLAQHNVERARQCALVLPPELNDNLCCGNSAIVEGLITLGCHEEAGKLLNGQVNRRKQLGQYITENGKRAPYFNPNLFYGCLGVGYELLRYAEPETVRSILA